MNIQYIRVVYVLWQNIFSTKIFKTANRKITNGFQTERTKKKTVQNWILNLTRPLLVSAWLTFLTLKLFFVLTNDVVPISWLLAFTRECNSWLGVNHSTLPMFFLEISPFFHIKLDWLWLSLQSHSADPHSKTKEDLHFFSLILCKISILCNLYQMSITGQRFYALLSLLLTRSASSSRFKENMQGRVVLGSFELGVASYLCQGQGACTRKPT